MKEAKQKERFYGNNKEFIQSQAFKEKVTFNKKLNQIIDEYRSKKEKKI